MARGLALRGVSQPGQARVYWDYAKVRYIVEGLPARAHAAASRTAAVAAAGAIHSRGSGALARDVAVPKGAGALMRGTDLAYRSWIGSNLPYARIEHFGGWIVAKNPDVYGRYLLYIRPSAERATWPIGSTGEIEATTERVFHNGKGYLELAKQVYLADFPAVYAAGFPR